MNSLAKTSWMFSSTKRWPTQVLIANSVAFVSVLQSRWFMGFFYVVT